MINALLSQDLVIEIYALFPPIFLSWQIVSTNFFAFWMCESNRHQQTPTDTLRHAQTLPDTPHILTHRHNPWHLWTPKNHLSQTLPPPTTLLTTIWHLLKSPWNFGASENQLLFATSQTQTTPHFAPYPSGIVSHPSNLLLAPQAQCYIRDGIFGPWHRIFSE